MLLLLTLITTIFICSSNTQWRSRGNAVLQKVFEEKQGPHTGSNVFTVLPFFVKFPTKIPKFLDNSKALLFVTVRSPTSFFGTTPLHNHITRFLSSTRFF